MHNNTEQLIQIFGPIGNDSYRGKLQLLISCSNNFETLNLPRYPDKILKKLQNNPKTLKWKEAVQLLQSLGFKKYESNRGSGVKFINDQKVVISMHTPHPENSLGPGATGSLISKLKDQGI